MLILALNITGSEIHFNALACAFPILKSSRCSVHKTIRSFIICERDLQRVKCTEIIEHENVGFFTIH